MFSWLPNMILIFSNIILKCWRHGHTIIFQQVVFMYFWVFHARSLMFDQFPYQWVWNWKLKWWTMCKRGFAISRMYYAHPTWGERYYLRMPHLANICEQWMAQNMTHSKMHTLQWVCLQTIMNGIKPWKKPVFGPQDDSCVTCLPPCWCFVRWRIVDSYGMHIGSLWAMTLK